MVRQVKDLSADQRLAIESLLGRALRDEESITIRPSVVLKEAPAGEDRARAFQQYQADLDRLGRRVEDVPEEEIDAAIQEAVRHARQKAE